MNADNKTARIAGLLYLAIIGAGIFAHFIVRASLLVVGDAAATAQNVLAARSFFQWGIAGDLVMIVCDIAVALLLYVLMKPVNGPLSLLAAFFRLIQAAILGVNLLNLFAVLQLLSGAAYLTALSTEQVYAQAFFHLQAFNTGYALGLVFFGLNCLIFGYLVFRSGYLPRVLGALLIFAGAGYLTDSLASFFLPTYANYADVFAVVVFLPAIIGELSLCLWLLVKGVGGETPVSKSVARPIRVGGANA
jgi:hypothetical protein